MKKGDKVRVKESGSGFGSGSVGNEYIVEDIVSKGYYGEDGVMLENYKNTCQSGRVGISCLEVISSESQYEIY